MTITDILAGLGLEFFPLLALGAAALLFSSYVKISTVLAILRAGLGFHSLPSVFVTGSLATVLTFFIMFPQLQQASLSIDEVVKNSARVDAKVKAKAIGEAGKMNAQAFKNSDVDFYMTNPIARASNVMAECSETQNNLIKEAAE